MRHRRQLELFRLRSSAAGPLVIAGKWQSWALAVVWPVGMSISAVGASEMCTVSLFPASGFLCSHVSLTAGQRAFPSVQQILNFRDGSLLLPKECLSGSMICVLGLLLPAWVWNSSAFFPLTGGEVFLSPGSTRVSLGTSVFVLSSLPVFPISF